MDSPIQQLRRASLLVLFCMAQAIFLLSPVFRIATIQVEGNQLLSREEILRESPFKVGSYYWAVWASHGWGPVLDDPAIISTSLSLQSGGRLILRVEERRAAVCVACPRSSSGWVVADAEGYILSSEVPPFDLPKLEVDFTVPLLGRMESALIGVALKAEPQVREILGTEPTLYQIDSMQNITLHLPFKGHSTAVKVGTLDNLRLKLQVLRTLLAKLRLQKKGVATIDVRFAQPVVQFVKATPAAKGKASKEAKEAKEPKQEGEATAPQEAEEAAAPQESSAASSGPQEPAPEESGPSQESSGTWEESPPYVEPELPPAPPILTDPQPLEPEPAPPVRPEPQPEPEVAPAPPPPPAPEPPPEEAPAPPAPEPAPAPAEPSLEAPTAPLPEEIAPPPPRPVFTEEEREAIP